MTLILASMVIAEGGEPMGTFVLVRLATLDRIVQLVSITSELLFSSNKT